MGWLIALCVLVLFLCMPVGVSGAYDAMGATVRLRVGPFRVTLYPNRKKQHTAKKKNDRSEVVKSATGRSQKRTTGRLSDFLPILRLVLDFVKDFRTKLRINMLEMKLVMAGDDPCDVAVNYGRAWALIGSILPQLENFFVIKKRDIGVSCDFTSEVTRISVYAELAISIGRILLLLGYHGIHILYSYLKIVNKRKGGAKA